MNIPRAVVSFSRLHASCLRNTSPVTSLLMSRSAQSVNKTRSQYENRTWWIQQQMLSSGTDKDSDDDFKPKHKKVPDDEDEIQEMIRQQVTDNKLMVYMKGTPSAPQCGFSMQVVRILHSQGVDFSSINILDYPSIRDGVKKYSDWPTIPQVYLNGEFIGGCDIMVQLHKTGELKTMLGVAGLLTSA